MDLLMHRKGLDGYREDKTRYAYGNRFYVRKCGYDLEFGVGKYHEGRAYHLNYEDVEKLYEFLEKHIHTKRIQDLVDL